jgi:hypothetical protein
VSSGYYLAIVYFLWWTLLILLLLLLMMLLMTLIITEFLNFQALLFGMSHIDDFLERVSLTAWFTAFLVWSAHVYNLSLIIFKVLATHENLLIYCLDILLTCTESLNQFLVSLINESELLLQFIVFQSQLVYFFFSCPFVLKCLLLIHLVLLDSLLKLKWSTLISSVLFMDIIELSDVFFRLLFKLKDQLLNLMFIVI